jgi:hypothetical protein
MLRSDYTRVYRKYAAKNFNWIDSKNFYWILLRLHWTVKQRIIYRKIYF